MWLQLITQSTKFTAGDKEIILVSVDHKFYTSKLYAGSIFHRLSGSKWNLCLLLVISAISGSRWNLCLLLVISAISAIAYFLQVNFQGITKVHWLAFRWCWQWTLAIHERTISVSNLLLQQLVKIAGILRECTHCFTLSGLYWIPSWGIPHAWDYLMASS